MLRDACQAPDAISLEKTIARRLGVRPFSSLTVNSPPVTHVVRKNIAGQWGKRPPRLLRPFSAFFARVTHVRNPFFAQKTIAGRRPVPPPPPRMDDMGDAMRESWGEALGGARVTGALLDARRDDPPPLDLRWGLRVPGFPPLALPTPWPGKSNVAPPGQGALCPTGLHEQKKEKRQLLPRPAGQGRRNWDRSEAESPSPRPSGGPALDAKGKGPAGPHASLAPLASRAYAPALRVFSSKSIL